MFLNCYIFGFIGSKLRLSFRANKAMEIPNPESPLGAPESATMHDAEMDLLDELETHHGQTCFCYPLVIPFISLRLFHSKSLSNLALVPNQFQVQPCPTISGQEAQCWHGGGHHRAARIRSGHHSISMYIWSLGDGGTCGWIPSYIWQDQERNSGFLACVLQTLGWLSKM